MAPKNPSATSVKKVVKKSTAVSNTKPTTTAPIKKKSQRFHKAKSFLFSKKTRNFRVGGDIQHRRDLTHFVRWPKYIRLQRQKRILADRLKIPPSIQQFKRTLDQNQTRELLSFLANYKPETRVQKKQRLVKMAASLAKDKVQETATTKPITLKYGLNHVTDLIEMKKAKLVVIANDVAPLELVVWLPALCRAKNVPYCIMNGKSKLGQLVHKKKTCVVAIDNVRLQDRPIFDNLEKNFRVQFNDNVESRRMWGGGRLGVKSRHAREKVAKALAAEMLKRAAGRAA